MPTNYTLSTNYRKSHRSILSRGRYSQTKHKRPLPTQEQEAQKKRVSSEDDSSDEESEADTGTDAQEIYQKPAKTKKTKKKKKPTKKSRNQLSSEDESEDENHQPSLPKNIRKGKEFQRLDSYQVKMGKPRPKKMGVAPKSRKRKQEDEGSEWEDEESCEEDEPMLKKLKPSKQTFIKHDPKLQKGIKAVIKDVFKEHVYPHYKFMTNEQGMFAIAEMTFDKMSFEDREYWSPSKLAKEKYNFVHDFADYIRIVMLNQRNQHQQNARDWAVKKIQADKTLPSPKAIEGAAKRMNLLGNGPVLTENREFFDLYNDEVIPKFAGAQRWGINKRCHGHLSTHAPTDDPKNPYVTVSDEAFAVVTYEGCYNKWKYMGDQKKNNEKVDKKNDSMDNSYINKKAGQAKYGGWTDQGLDRYKALRDSIKRARAKKITWEIEEASMKSLRKKHEVDKKIADREADPKKKRKEKSAYCEGSGLV